MTLLPTNGTIIQQSAQLTQRQRRWMDLLIVDLDEAIGLHELLNMVLQRAFDATGAEAGSISLVDHERQELMLQVYDGYNRPMDTPDLHSDTRRRRAWESSLPGQVARTRRPVLIRDVARDAEAQSLGQYIRAELVLPIVDQDRVLAVLVLDSPRASAFGDGEVALALALCERAALPLRRALRYHELLEVSTQLGQVFTSMTSGLVLLDTQGRVLRHNPAWLAVWGITMPHSAAPFHVPLDLVPQLITRLKEPHTLINFCDTGRQQPTEILTETIVLQYPHQELSLLSVPTRDSFGRLTGRLWVVNDVTRERESDRLKSEFISIVSHELRTPLTSILGYTELLLGRNFAPVEQRDFLNTVFSEATHLSKIVEDLLGFTRLEAGRVQLEFWTLPLYHLLREMMPQVGTFLSANHKLLIDVPESLPPIHADRDKVRQILNNLLNNAAKYSPQGGEIALSAHEAHQLPSDHPPGAWMLITIRDQGLGIPSDELPRIWDRFYRVDNSNTRRIGGTGLGLSIVRRLVEMHGGQIWAESQVGVGSIFRFTLPIANELARREDTDPG